VFAYLNRRSRLLAGLVLLMLADPSEAAPPADMEAVVEEYQADHSSVSGFYDLPWSIACFDRMERLQHDWQRRLDALEFEPLDQHGRVDYLLLRTKLGSELDDQALERRRLAELAELIPFREQIQALEEARWRLDPVDAEKAASRLALVPDQVKQLRERIDLGKKTQAAQKKDAETKPADKTGSEPKKDAPSSEPKKDAPAALKPSPSLAIQAATAVGSLRGSLRTWFTFYDGFTPEFSWWVRKPHEVADKALEEYAKYLREEIAGQHGKDEDPLIGYSVGVQPLQRLLAGALIAYSPREIVAIGERELAWCEREMRKAARELGFAENWKAALAKVKSSFVPPGAQDDLVAQQAREAIRFVKEHDLVTVPPLCEETWRLTMTAPEQQKTMPYAAYGGQEMTVAYATESMKHDDKLMAMRGNNRHFTRIVTAHELIPGHHLERFQSSRYRTYRRLFSTPFFVEGWGLYWELRLWDLNYAKSPEERVGMLFWRMNRAARIIVSFRFHLGTMSPVEMVDFLVEQVGNERFGATSEVRRYLQYPPLYQAAYMLGGLQLHALHKEAVGSGRMNEKAFHDAVLHGHAMPVEMVRAELLNLPLSRDFKPQWRFADPLTDKH
jgi:uncharacterized protein (DUF885 family)